MPVRNVKYSRSTQERANAAHRSGELLVRFRTGVSNVDKATIRAMHGARKKKDLQGESGIEKLELLSGSDAQSVAAQMLLSGEVEFAEPNFVIEKDHVIANDDRFNEQWALRNTGQNGGQFGSDVNATGAWKTTTGSKSTVIAIIDSGIDFTHPDLANNQWFNPAPGVNGDVHGWDYVDDSAEVKDEEGHGTAVAGIIAAEGNNSAGTTGVMWRASLMSLRVLNNTGAGDVANAIEAIDYAVAHGAQVVNLSWGTNGESLALKDAIERALRRNVVVVCSAGNGSRDLAVGPYYPASFDLNLISVAGSDNFDRLASWSNWNARSVTIAAPGTNILTTQRGGGYWSVSGTSAAAPIVSGIAGLVKTFRPGATAQAVVRAIKQGARKSASLSGKVASGGVANAEDALAHVHGPAGTFPLPPKSGGSSGGFNGPPPPTSTGAPGTNLPNIAEVRNTKPQEIKPTAQIEANLPCADCDPYGGGGGVSNYPASDPNFSTARRIPTNETGQPGVDLGSRNFNWSLPLLSLPGRAGLDLNLTLFYNSLVWTRDGSFMKFNADLGSPAPGFSLGFPKLQQRFLNSQTGIWAYMMVTPAGARVELRQVGTSNIYESQDSSYTQLDVTSTTAPVLRTTDGTQFKFKPVNINGEYRCDEIKDRNGNYISANYDTTNGHLLTVTDTLGRQVYFDYDVSGNLTAIRQTWNGAAHQWATFDYGQVLVAPAFGGGLQINGPNGNNTTVLTRVNLHDGSYFTFDYNTAFAQVKRINHYAYAGNLLNYTSYNVSSASGQTECPRFTERRDWAANWNNGNEAITNYTVSGTSWTQQTAPDGTIYKEFFATSGWQTGLATMTEIWSGGVKKKYTTTAWTQDDTSLSYRKNPRVTETNIYDAEGNRRRTTIEYGQYAQYGLPYGVREYAADGITEIRQTWTDYNLSPAYVNRRIIGLVSFVHVSNVAQWQRKLSFEYDDPARLSAMPAAATQHDTTYNASFTARGNVTSVSRWDITDVNNAVKKLTAYANYNTTGNPVSLTDPANNQKNIAYADSFSDAVNRNTFAYPTTMTDADGFQTLSKYNFDFGAITWSQTPSPNAGHAGPITAFTYDSVGRLQQISNTNVNFAHVRWVYPTDSSYVQTFTTVVNGLGESYSIQVLDGAGRVRATAADHPGSTGLYSGQNFVYDNMGRVAQQSNPTEVTGAWAVTGDDTAWVYTLQAYDWQGRPTLTTLPDGSTRENTYGGCGCAGGAVTTVRDEAGRRRKLTTDVLGRLKQVDELNWDQSVYATTTYTYNVRDQLTQINQAGQTRTFGFDGYGRLATRTTPEQGATNYSYFADDKVQTITDARGATTTFSYNNRRLVTGLTYGVPGGVASTPNATFTYDAAGNRKSMTDGLGSVNLVYDQLSRLTSETRTFTGVGTYDLSYSYNLGNEVTSITNPWGVMVGYVYDKTGRPTSVTGSGYGGVSSYVGSMSYRAFGLKQMNYSNGRTLSLQYDNRLRPTQWNIPGVMGWNYAYSGFNERTGRVTYAGNINDNTLDRSYHYDHVGRLQSSHSGLEARVHVGLQPGGGAPDGPYAQRYYYDQFGNVTWREGWGGENPAFSLASFTGNKRDGLTYDAAGNVTNDGGQNFTYDATGQQAMASYSGYSLQQYYDGDGLRAKKTENGLTSYYLRSSVLGGQIIAEIVWWQGSWQWRRGYVYLGGQMLAMQDANAIWWVHQDLFVKSKRVTNGSGAVVSTVELDPWGGHTNRNNTAAFQPQAFTTYFRDDNASDDAMFRRYNRWWSRFDQPDPYDGSYDLTNPQSFNRYAYTQNDPVNRVDPTGLLPGVCWWEYSLEFGMIPGPCYDRWGGFDPKPGGGGGGDGGGTNAQNPPADTSEAERLMTESCLHFLNSILAELGKFRDPYSFNFGTIFRKATAGNGKNIRTVRLTDEEKRERLGGTHSVVGDSAFYINLDVGLFNRGDFTAGYTLIHELFHAAATAVQGYNHTEMATAAYKVALSNQAMWKRLQNYGNSGPPKDVEYTLENYKKEDDWYNAGVFDAIIRIGCPIPPG